MAGEDSEPEKMCSELAGTHFTIGKIKFDENSGVQKVRNQIKCGILRNPNGFPNLVQPPTLLAILAQTDLVLVDMEGYVLHGSVLLCLLLWNRVPLQLPHWRV